MSYRNKILAAVLCLLVFFHTDLWTMRTYAAVKQADLVTTKTQKDLVVMFHFDQEIVDITFLSPSGVRKQADDPDVAYAEGELWSTYRIADAEIGTWSVSYDLKGNDSIDYSIIEDDYGLWIQYVTASEPVLDQIDVRFQADCEAEVVNYQYKLYAVNTQDTTINHELTGGSARSNEEKKVQVSLSTLASDNYLLRLEVSYRDGTGELFDALATEAFDYTNPQEPDGIEGYRLFVDAGNRTCTVDWQEYGKRGYDGYRIKAYSDGVVIYDSVLEADITSVELLYPDQAADLVLELAYRDNGVWSAPLTKTVDLSEEYLRLETADVTGAGEAVLGYRRKEAGSMELTLNGEAGVHQLSGGEEKLYIGLIQGSNTIYAQMESTADAAVCYVVDSELYFDAYPPEISLFEALDGKTFYTGEADIIGSVTGASELKINGESIAIEENGSFRCRHELQLGENSITIEALDVNGNSSMMTLTLYRESSVLAAELPSLLPLVISLVISLVLIALSFLFMKKKEKQTAEEKKIRIWPWILADVAAALYSGGCLYGYFVHTLFRDSIQYLELAEQSTLAAASYWRTQRILGVLFLVGLLFFIVCMSLTVLAMMKKRGRHME